MHVFKKLCLQFAFKLVGILLWMFSALEFVRVKVNMEPKAGPQKMGGMDIHLLWLHSMHALPRPDPPSPQETVFH